MPGVKGRGGPPPKRSDQRRRRNKTAAEQRAGDVTKAPGERNVEVPEPGQWSEPVRRWYLSLRSSGQSAYYQSSDWASAWLMCDAIDRELHADGAVKSATLAAWLKLCAALLVTEGDRRRAALELTRPQQDDDEAKPAPVTDLRAWKESLNR